MDGETQNSLTWLGDHQYEELRALRAAEDNLFNWATSMFLAGFGALTGLRGLTEARWGLNWRLMIIIGLALIDGVILMLAYLNRMNLERSQAALSRILAQLPQTSAATAEREQYSVSSQTADRLYFYLRWGVVGFMGLITIVLVWMLG